MRAIVTATILAIGLLVSWTGLVVAQNDTADLGDIPLDAVSVLESPIQTVASSTLSTSTFVQQQQGRRIGGRRVDKTPLNAAKVNRSIKLAIDYLKSQQNPDGSWPKTKYPGDCTALCTLALLNSGEDPTQPYLRRALDNLQGIERSVTYVVSLRIMALAAADPKGKRYIREVQKDVDWLLQIQQKDGVSAGSWNYGYRVGQGDASNTQFALLALHEATRMGVKKISKAKWELAKKFWIKVYRQNGGFAYYANGQKPVGSMTCAGISSWIIINENLTDSSKLTNGEFANCCQANPDMEKVDAAFNWLAKYYSVSANPGKAGTVLYYLYGLERASRLAGRRFIGQNDWYRDGAKHLIKSQKGNKWATRGGHGENNPLVGTSFGLLFLSKGKRPVAIGKFNHGVKNWDLHPRGLHYLTRRLETEWSTKLNWQTVRANGSTVDDLLETPVLFMSGKDAIGLDPKQKKVLQEYLENGGFLFAEAYDGDGCGKAIEYDKAFRELMTEIFPGSSLDKIEKEHPIWHAHNNLIWNNERPLLGLQACCRTSVVYCPTNLSCYWQLDQPAVMDDANIDARLRKRIEYCSDLGVNVVAYATGRDLKEKGETPRVLDRKIEQLTDRVLVFPKLSHGGGAGADDAPNAWRKILHTVKTTLNLDMKTEKKMISPSFEELADHPFIFMHGRTGFSFTPEQRTSIRDSLENGGFIFADSICASSEFTESFRNEMKEILGAKLGPIPPEHDIWTNSRIGYVIKKVTLRTRDTKSPGGFREEQRPPELEGVEINGRLAVVFSPNDLSCALENVQHSQCTGYTHDDAKRIGFNVILYYLLSD